MIKILVAAICIASLQCFSTDYKVCTNDANAVIDIVFKLAEELENDPYNPSAADFKLMLDMIEKFSVECLQIPIDLSKYDNCVDLLIPVFPSVKKLVQDIKDNNTTAILFDVSSIALTVIDGLEKCAKPTLHRLAAAY